jgi:hypothetical protein
MRFLWVVLLCLAPVALAGPKKAPAKAPAKAKHAPPAAAPAPAPVAAPAPAPAAAPAVVAPKPKKGPKTHGEITWVGAEFAFVNKGTADGVDQNAQLLLTRGGRSSGTCAVVAVAEHSARCTGANVRVGDRFSVTAPAVAALELAKPLPTDAELRRCNAVVESTEWTLREFQGGAGFGSGLRASASLSHTTFLNLASTSPEYAPTNLQRVDASLIDFEIYKGLRTTIDLTVLNFSSRPGVTRTLYQQSPVLLVRQLEIGFRRADLPYSASLGRTWLSTGPGLLVLDGARAAYRIGAVELGAFAGLLPDAARLTPTLTQWSAGAYSRVQLSSGEGASANIVQIAGRAGYALRETVGSRFEAAAGAAFWAGVAFDAHASVEVGYGENQAPGGIDAARVDLGYRPNEKLSFLASGRYRGLPVSGLTEVGLVSPGLRALHADASATYAVTPGMIVGLRSGVATDFTASLLQVRVGPELVMPTLGGLPLALGVGYVEEAGWLRGRSAYVSFGVSAGQVFRVTSRTSIFHQQPSAGAEGLFTAEVGETLAIEVAPWRFLRARVLVMGRQVAGERFAPFGTVGGQLSGSF